MLQIINENDTMTANNPAQFSQIAMSCKIHINQVISAIGSN